MYSEILRLVTISCYSSVLSYFVNLKSAKRETKENPWRPHTFEPPNLSALYTASATPTPHPHCSSIHKLPQEMPVHDF